MMHCLCPSCGSHAVVYVRGTAALVCVKCSKLPACTWCGDDGFARMTEETVLCLSDFEYVQLHPMVGCW